jgi:uncharacterized delta-60 repeat protein
VSELPLDSSFGDAGVIRNVAPAIGSPLNLAVQNDGSILIAGRGLPGQLCVTRRRPDGAPDTTFGTAGTTTIELAVSPSFVEDESVPIAVAPNGDIFLACTVRKKFESFANEWRIVKLTPQGRLDASFSGDGMVTATFPGLSASGVYLTAVVLRDDGRVLAVGTKATARVLVAAQYLPDGDLDRSFANDGRLLVDLQGSLPTVTSAALDPSGNLVVSGTVWFPDTSGDMFAARFLPDGRKDTSFGFGGTTIVDFGTGEDRAFDMALLPDGTIVILGVAGVSNVAREPALLRLGHDGRPDPSFGVAGRVRLDIGFPPRDCWTERLRLMPDGRIALTGTYAPGRDDPVDPALGSFRLFMAMVHPDGTPDPTFDGSNGVAFLAPELSFHRRHLAVQPDGNVVWLLNQVLLRVLPVTDRVDLSLVLGADQFQAGPGPLFFTATVRNTGPNPTSAFLKLRASKPVGVVGSSQGQVTVAANRIDVTGKLGAIAPGASATATLRTTVTGFEGAIELSGSVSTGDPDLTPANNHSSITVLTGRDPTM